MAKVIKGPFNIVYGANTLAEISAIKVAYSVDTTDTSTVQGQKIRTYGAHQVILTVTFLQSDVASLAVALPQYFVANGGVLSTGETITDPVGAIDLVPGGCASGSSAQDLIIYSCGTNAQVLRIVQAASEIDGLTMDEKSLTVDVNFVGVSTGATIQLFNTNAIAHIS